PLQHAAARSLDVGSDEEREKWRQVLKIYRDAGVEFDLLTAILLDDMTRVKAILKKSPKFADDFQGQSPLRTAASRGHLEICRYLIDKYRVDVDDFERGIGYPIIKVALQYPDIVRLLIENGADLKTRISWRGMGTGIWIIGEDATALHFAADDGVPETI